MSGLTEKRFRCVDGKKISGDKYTEDFKSAPVFGRVRLGKLYLYYRDLLKNYCVPYKYIDRIYTKIVVCPENEFANNEEYYRLILVHGETEFANLIFEKQSIIKALYTELEKINPNIIFGV